MTVPSETIAHLVEAGSLGVAFFLKALWDMRERRKHRGKFDSGLDLKFNAIRYTIDNNQQLADGQHAETMRAIEALSAHVIGPDGKNGLRGAHHKLERRVDGLEERERDRLQRPYDRRTDPRSADR